MCVCVCVCMFVCLIIKYELYQACCLSYLKLKDRHQQQ